MTNNLLPGERMDIDPTTLHVGDQVMYLATDRGGYGFVTRVPAVVIGISRKRVRIRTPALVA